MAEEQVTLTIDNVEVTVPKGTTVLEAANTVGIKIPHFCYHPQLSIAGVCRMCLVEIEKMPKLATSCSTLVGPGMVVRTTHTSDRVRRAVREVLELHFINHPIDCPICDQAGECKLQEYYWDYGLYSSRFKEQKVTNPKHSNIGPMVVLDADRCILCSRCVRFCREVPQTEELCIVYRGDHAEITLGTGKKLDNAYSANVVDICPVGAHTLRDFRFQCRAWYLKKTPSVCPGCARGCSITVEHHKGRVHRLKPRFNPEVNGPWMCDLGRLTYQRLYTAERLEEPMVRQDGKLVATSWDKALEQAAQKLKAAGTATVGLGSAHATNEENFLLGQVMAALSSSKLAVGTAWESRGEDDALLRRADLAPNRTGAQRILGSATLGDAIEGAKGAVLLGDNVLKGAPEGVSSALGKSVKLVVLTTHLDETAREAEVALPIAAFAERGGTVTNFEGQTQNTEAAVPPPGSARPAVAVLAQLIAALGGAPVKDDLGSLFDGLVKKVPTFKGLKLTALAPYGAGKASAQEANP